jgi:hypothetical protein
MTIRWNDAQLRAAMGEGAERLLQAALFFQQQHMQRLNVANSRGPMPVKFKGRRYHGTHIEDVDVAFTAMGYPNSSRPGEYPRKRSGFAQANVVFGPETPDEIVHQGLTVKLGVRSNAAYLATLEFLRERKGFLDTMKDLQPEIKAILE